jgi:hypothetical protein
MAVDPNVVRTGVLNHAIREGTIRADQRDAWDRLMRADLNGSIEELNKLAEQKRAVSAAVRRGNPDEIVAAAVAEAGSAPRGLRSGAASWTAIGPAPRGC